ncbi:MAG: hypothetical protein A4E48_02654 [Methanosaeta sp. PtaU1.Bin060]|jgi:hypothetical protein|nr:MAG: hypothetical protein A4E48_02654 [Methanosaeta sp. PtaU1.Bin060]
MNLEFDFNSIRTIEFGIGLKDGEVESYHLMAVDANVQATIREMVIATWNTMNDSDNDPPMYDPSEKYESSEYVYLPLSNELANRMRELHDANNLPMDSNALADPTKIFSYFIRMTDIQSHRLTALRRANQSKAALRARFIMKRLLSDALELVEDKVFKLDKDFDLLIDASNVHILRPRAFESISNIQAAILAAVPINVSAIQSDLAFVDLAPIQNYASNHPRAARYLASIRCQNQTKNIDRLALEKLCISTGVKMDEVNGKIIIKEKDVMGFLEVLDRRRYNLELVKESAECFKATARKKINRVEG